MDKLANIAPVPMGSQLKGASHCGKGDAGLLPSSRPRNTMGGSVIHEAIVPFGLHT